MLLVVFNNTLYYQMIVENLEYLKFLNKMAVVKELQKWKPLCTLKCNQNSKLKHSAFAEILLSFKTSTLLCFGVSCDRLATP